MAGARVVPLSYHASDAEVDEIFDQADGALFSGGGGDVPPAAMTKELPRWVDSDELAELERFLQQSQDVLQGAVRA